MTIEIPADLNPAITIPREALEICLPLNLADWGEDGPVALTWRWALTGEGRMPLSGLPWSGGLPRRGDLEFEIRVDPRFRHPRAPDEGLAAQALLWWLTSTLADEIPYRFRRSASAPDYVVSAGSVTVAMSG